MVLVTGAAGKTGTAVIRALAAKGATVRAWVRRAEQVEQVIAVGATEAVVGDMLNTAVWQQATKDVHALYHICPNMHPNEVEIGKIAIAAAQTNGVDRFVYHSVMHPHIKQMPHHWHKMEVEACLFASGLAFTILQPAAYMQNILNGWEALCQSGIYTVPYPVTTKISVVDLADVATVAAQLLTETGHEFAIYELAGPQKLSQLDVAANLQIRLQKPVVAQEIVHGVWRKNAQDTGLDTVQIETLLRMFCYYAAYGFVGNSNMLAWLLRRSPTTFAQFLQRQTGTSQ